MDSDARCSLVSAFPQVFAGNLVLAAVVSGLLITLRRWESDLRTDTARSEKSETYSRRLHVARLAIVGLAAVAAVVFLAAATRDPACAA